MCWPPKIGDQLSRSDQVWFEAVKLEDWILAERGHGLEWRRVFHVGPQDRDRLWNAIVAAVQDVQIVTVRDRGVDGIVCGVEVELAIGERTAPVTISWHYASEDAAPRLATAHPTLYD